MIAKTIVPFKKGISLKQATLYDNRISNPDIDRIINGGSKEEKDTIREGIPCPTSTLVFFQAQNVPLGEMVIFPTPAAVYIGHVPEGARNMRNVALVGIDANSWKMSTEPDKESEVALLDDLRKSRKLVYSGISGLLNIARISGGVIRHYDFQGNVKVVEDFQMTGLYCLPEEETGLAAGPGQPKEFKGSRRNILDPTNPFVGFVVRGASHLKSFAEEKAEEEKDRAAAEHGDTLERQWNEDMERARKMGNKAKIAELEASRPKTGSPILKFAGNLSPSRDIILCDPGVSVGVVCYASEIVRPRRATTLSV